MGKDPDDGAIAALAPDHCAAGRASGQHSLR
jgi:hypothetical protein